MESLLGTGWRELFGLSLSPLEIIVRGTATYWFLFLIFRFVIRREVGAVGVADILILVLVADASQNAMSGQYKTISDGMVLVSTLIGWNVLMDWLSFRFPRVRRFTDPPPLSLIRNGRILVRNLRREFLTEEELWGKLREQGVDSLEQIKDAYMEADGQISVLYRKGRPAEAGEPGTAGGKAQVRDRSGDRCGSDRSA